MNYTIQPGDNLSTIASRYGLSISTIMNANVGNPAIANANLIYAGRSINIPTASSNNQAQKATLYNPQTGAAIVVDVGSAQASNLQSQGYTLTPPAKPVNNASPSNSNQTMGNWYISAWKTQGNTWVQQPTLTVNGQTYVFATPQEYMQKLQELKGQGATGPIDQFINEFNSAIQYWSPQQTQTNQQPATYTGPTTTVADIKIPTELADNPYFKQLGPDDQKMIAYYWQIQESQSTEKTKAFRDALQMAGQQADPYWKEKINIVTDELSRSLGSLSSEYSTREAELMKRKKQIDEDLVYNRSDLSAEQTAELAARKQAYDKELEDLRGEMASKGLTFSSIKNKAMERASDANDLTVGSIQRRFAKEARTNEVNAERNIADVDSQVSELKRKFGESQTDIVRKSEEYLGSSTLATAVPSVSSLMKGNISGSMLEDKSRDVLSRAQGLMASNYGIT